MPAIAKSSVDVLEALEKHGPMTCTEISSLIIRHEESIKKWMRSLCKENMAHWCGHRVGNRYGSGRRARLFAPGEPPIKELRPMQYSRPVRKPKEEVVQPVIHPALHPIAKWTLRK